MDNCTVCCDVGACAHNIDCRKCGLSQIQITHHSQNQASGVDTPHYCQSFEEK